MKYKLTIAYDGTLYGGWQIQPNATSIQALIEEALRVALRIPTPLTGASRTDAGVHARAQVAHFTAEERLDLFRLQGSLNGLLPLDIRITHVDLVPEEFHARYSALSKEYHYHLHLDKVMDPFKRLYSAHIHHPVDLTLLRTTAALFVGTHDFTSFANEFHEGSAAKNPVRTLSRLDVVEESGGVRLEFAGDSFLYKMVRNITGTLLDVTAHKIAPTSIPDIFQKKDRQKAGKAAHAHALFLEKILY